MQGLEGKAGTFVADEEGAGTGEVDVKGGARFACFRGGSDGGEEAYAFRTEPFPKFRQGPALDGNAE